MVTKCDLVAAKLLCLAVQIAAAHARTQVARVFLAVVGDRENIGLEHGDRDMQQCGVALNFIAVDLVVAGVHNEENYLKRDVYKRQKLYYNAMKEGKTGITRDSLPIELTLDKANRRFIIEDHGCGMTAEEMENNLGTIAHSGSLAFKNENEKQDDIDIIGQFGVGFYAAFMVAKHVEVVSRAAGSDEANRWESDGADGYTAVSYTHLDVYKRQTAPMA